MALWVILDQNPWGSYRQLCSSSLKLLRGTHTGAHTQEHTHTLLLHARTPATRLLIQFYCRTGSCRLLTQASQPSTILWLDWHQGERSFPGRKSWAWRLSWFLPPALNKVCLTLKLPHPSINYGPPAGPHHVAVARNSE